MAAHTLEWELWWYWRMHWVTDYFHKTWFPKNCRMLLWQICHSYCERKNCTTFCNNPKGMSVGGLSREKIPELFYYRTVETMNLRECCFAFEVLTASGHKNAYQRKYKKRLTADGKMGNISSECDLTCDLSLVKHKTDTYMYLFEYIFTWYTE